MEKILLIDANLLLFRSFYAAQVISKEPSNMTTHLFFNSALEIIKEIKPNFVFFAFDAYGPTKRHQEFAEYKAKRIKAPQELYDQKKVIQDILSEMNLKWWAKIGDEADDLIATLTKRYQNNYEIIILSEDRDLLQLVDKNVVILQKDKNKKNEKKYIEINIENFYQIYQIFPIQVVDYKGIAGDTSDNLMGIKGIGPKTAIELLSKYQNLEGIYQNIDELTSKQKLCFITNKENAFMCKKLATLNNQVEIDFDLKALKYKPEILVNKNVSNILEKYKLKRIWEIIKKM